MMTLALCAIISAQPQASGAATNKGAAKTSAPKTASPSATPDQKYSCSATGQGEEHFTVNFGAKTVKTGDVVLGAGAPREWQVTDVHMTEDSIAFTLGGKMNLGGVTLVRVSKITIDRKDGTYTIQTADNPPAKGKCTTSTDAKAQ
jgi:hypothetical protein